MIISTFKRHGAETIDTPVFELKEVTSQYYEKIELLYAMVEEAILTHHQILTIGSLVKQSVTRRQYSLSTLNTSQAKINLKIIQNQKKDDIFKEGAIIFASIHLHSLASPLTCYSLKGKLMEKI